MTTTEKRLLRWGHGDEAVEEPYAPSKEFSPPTHFNGATAMKPWKSPMLRRNFSPPTDFNGATAMKPWKRIVLPGGLWDTSVTSMGPRR